MLAKAGRSVSPLVAATAAATPVTDGERIGGRGGSIRGCAAVAAGGERDGGDVSVEDLLALHALALSAAAAEAAAGGTGKAHGYEGYDLQNKVGYISAP